jgi:tRNA (cytidine56-2'-O)-methyltransferase
MNISVLRLDHRRRRDARITTHVCLTARAFGANEVILSGERDKKLMENVEDVRERWGGSFNVSYQKNWDNLIEEWKKNGGEVIHLTMYGTPVQEAVQDIQRSTKDKLVVVGGSRVPTPVYKAADWNVSVTTQPHSEVSSLGVFMHMLMDGKEFDLDFEGGELEVVPSAEGKKIITHEEFNSSNNGNDK